jgi:hypothetical protein
MITYQAFNIAENPEDDSVLYLFSIFIAFLEDTDYMGDLINSSDLVCKRISPTLENT